MEHSFISSLTFSWRFISTVFYLPLSVTIQGHDTPWYWMMKLQSSAAGAEGNSITNAWQCRAISTTPIEQLDVKVPLIHITGRQTLLLHKSHGYQELSMQADALLGTLPQNSQVKPTIVRNPYSFKNPRWQ